MKPKWEFPVQRILINHDWLIFTTSTEDTTNSYNDGAIGNSYLGVIEDAYRKITKGRIRINELIDVACNQ